MNSEPTERDKDKPRNWNDILGPFYRKSDLPASAANDKGLITLETSDKTEACPQFQFERNNQGELVINTHVASAWGLFLALQISQLGESAWTKAGNLAQSRPEYDDQSWADILKHPDTHEQTRLDIYAAIVEDAVIAAEKLSVELVDPRKMLSE